MRTFWISLGAIGGANARYWVGVWLTALAPSAFPWGTFAINISGSALLGAFVAVEARYWPGWSTPRLLVAVGFCGAYTTFSTFSLDLFDLLRQEAYLYVVVYGLASLLTALLALVGSYQLATALTR